MESLKDQLTKIARALGATNAALTLARARWKRWQKIGAKTHTKAVRRSKRADEERAAGHLKRAVYFDGLAVRASARAQKAQRICQQRVAQVKRLNQKRKGLLTTQTELLARLKELQGKVSIDGNKVTGGTRAERLRSCMLASAAKCSSGRRANFYSQGGTWDVSHCITGEVRGHRSDCSSWFTSLYFSCGLSDPNGNDFRGGYTGTLASHGRTISRSDARTTPGAAILYGSFPCHHIEAAIGDGSEHTIGHGSAPVDMGVFDLLPGPIQYRTFY